MPDTSRPPSRTPFHPHMMVPSCLKPVTAPPGSARRRPGRKRVGGAPRSRSAGRGRIGVVLTTDKQVQAGGLREAVGLLRPAAVRLAPVGSLGRRRAAQASSVVSRHPANCLGWTFTRKDAPPFTAHANGLRITYARVPEGPGPPVARGRSCVIFPKYPPKERTKQPAGQSGRQVHPQISALSDLIDENMSPHAPRESRRGSATARYQVHHSCTGREERRLPIASERGTGVTR